MTKTEEEWKESSEGKKLDDSIASDVQRSFFFGSCSGMEIEFYYPIKEFLQTHFFSAALCRTRGSHPTERVSVFSQLKCHYHL